MDWWQAAIYGVVQGITEFLPVSSSGHLALLPHVLEIQDPGVAFDLAMHVGTALSILVYYRSELGPRFRILAGYLRGQWRDAFWNNIFISTTATVLMVLALRTYSEEFGRSPLSIGVNLIIFGLLMAASDLIRKNGTSFFETSLAGRAGLVGVAQAIAIFPGVSRSGVTLLASRFVGVERAEAAKFSLLMSVPLIFMGMIAKLPELQSVDSISIGSVAIGIGVSFLSGLGAIHLLLGIVRRVGLWPFCVYRLLLGAAVLTLV